MWKSWRAPRVIVVKPSRSSLPGAASSETEPRLSRPTVLSRAPRERAEEVMSEQAFAILLASSFTFGCAAIHLWREHAADLVLVLTTLLLTPRWSGIYPSGSTRYGSFSRFLWL